MINSIMLQLLNPNPIPNPIAVAINPIKRIYIPAFTLFNPITVALISPSEKSSTEPIQIDGIHGWVFSFIIPAVTI